MALKDFFQLPGLSKMLESLGELVKEKENDIKEYKDIVDLRIGALTGKCKTIGRHYQAYYQATYSTRHEKEQVLRTVLFGGKNTVQEVLDDGLKDFFYGLLPRAAAEAHCELALRQMDYIYEHSAYRRSFRTNNLQDYFPAITSLMRSVYFNWYDFDLAAHLGMSDEEVKEKQIPRPDSFMVSQLMALEIDKGNRQVIETAKEIILSENNARIIDHTFVRGIAKSHNEELYALLMRLLLAAKLQEGLRQVVLETADDGTVEYFRLVIQTILSNNLLRFSSCIRAVNVWLGLGYDYEDKRIIQKILNRSNELLDNPSAREEALESPDVIEMYCAMWAESVYSAAGLRRYIDKYSNGQKYQRMAALYFLHQMGNIADNIFLAAEHLDEEDLDIAAWVHLCYNPSSGWARDKETYLQNCKSNPVLADKASRERQFEQMASTLLQIPKDGHTVDRKPFDWCRITLHRADVFGKLMVVNGYEESPEKTGRLIDLASYASSAQKIPLLNYFIQPERSAKEREFLFASLSDKSMPVRIAAAKLIKEIAISEEERLKIENLLALKSGEIRQIALDIIKSQETEQILDSVERLIADKAANKRLGALDILKSLLDRQKLAKEDAQKYIALMPKATEPERVLVDELQQEETAQYTLANGFGLYNVGYRPEFPPVEPIPQYTLKKFRNVTIEDCVKVIQSLVEVIAAHKDYTFSQLRWDNSEADCILGNLNALVVPKEHGFLRAGDAAFEQLVLAEVWREWLQKEGVSLMVLNRIRFAKRMGGYAGKYELTYEKWANQIFDKAFGHQELQK